MAKLNFTALLKAMVDQNSSDLHLAIGVPPYLRMDGKLVKIKVDPLQGDDVKDLVYGVLTDRQKQEFETKRELDFSFGVKDLSRFRGNLFIQRGSVAAVIRRIPFQIPAIESLGLPSSVVDLTKKVNGLVLVCGPTGSGKTTTLAAMLEKINQTENAHIVTVEDPVEYLYTPRGCLVNQREVGSDTFSFQEALKRILRQDPDYILVGELRDLETIEMALTMAETGHLVFGTLHTNNAVQSIYRVINVFPPHQQPQIRQLLSFVLQGVICQQLIPKSQGVGRCLALEVLIPNSAIRNLIREDKVHQVYSSMQSGQDVTGMFTMNQSLAQLVKQGQLTKQDAMSFSHYGDELNKLLGGGTNTSIVGAR